MSLTSYRPHGLEAMDANGPALLLAAHHEHLIALGQRVLVAAHGDDHHALHAAYRELERHIRDHMAAEEDLILPAFAAVEPEEAAVIRAEHALLRGRLERMAVAIELHQVRLLPLRELLQAHEEHAKREDRTMYPWAQVHLPAGERTSLVARIRDSLTKLVHSAS